LEALDVQALLVVSFGGPEAPEEVMPFLRRIVTGRGVPDERLAQVAKQYDHFGGVSPINANNRELVSKLRVSAPQKWFGDRVYLGNRNSAPFLADTVAEMVAAGITKAAVFITSAFSSYSGCRQYREDLARAQDVLTAAIDWRVAPRFFDHPVLVDIWARRLRAALKEASSTRVGQTQAGDGQTKVIFVTHSLPTSAATLYEPQHRDLAAAIIGSVDPQLPWELAFQSRSGPPQQPWLEPDIADALTAAAGAGFTRVMALPIGFVSDNLEIRWDLDVTAAAVAEEHGIDLVRLETPQSDEHFTALVWDVLVSGPSNNCAIDCCPNPRGPQSAVGDRR